MTYSNISILGCFIGLAIFALFTKGLKKTGRFFCAHLIAFFIAWFYGFRSVEVGVDTGEYVSRYLNQTVTSDYLFSYGGVFLHSIGFSSSQYLFVIALLTSLCLLHAIRRFSGDYSSAALFIVLAAFLPYGLMQYINIARQGLAVSILLLAASFFAGENRTKGALLTIAAIGLHRTTGFIFLGAQLIKRTLSSIFSPIIIITIIAGGFILSSFVGEILAIFDEDLAFRYLKYSQRDTSEAWYLIYLKITWAFFHWFILSRLNKVQEFPSHLYYYFVGTVIVSTALAPNELVSSRLLASLDFILPVLYSISTGIPGKSLRKVGIISLVIYAVVSPHLFNMYAVNFNW